jgi:hypothetical protein
VPLIGKNKHTRKYQVAKYSKHAQDYLFAKFQALAFSINLICM